MLVLNEESNSYSNSREGKDGAAAPEDVEEDVIGAAGDSAGNDAPDGVEVEASGEPDGGATEAAFLEVRETRLEGRYPFLLLVRSRRCVPSPGSAILTRFAGGSSTIPGGGRCNRL
jgi:hypothetical protein